MAVAVLRRPSLWPTAFRVVRRTAAPGWWRRPPFVPLPPADYLGFRMVTQYGTTDGSPEPSDVLNYLA
ncbi:MAG: hypothetical protein HKN41_11100, partial [Ilumatobacter sp.]|nr:hypothetical protein [Ilumatobacter sp.]